MWSLLVTSETSLWLFSDSVCVTRMKLAVLSVACYSANSRFASQVLHVFHSSIGTSQPFLDVVCHGLSCILAQRFCGSGVQYLGSGATNHKAPHLFVDSSLHHSPNRVLWPSSWVAPLGAATSFCTDSSAVSMSEQVRLPMIASTKYRGSEFALELRRCEFVLRWR